MSEQQTDAQGAKEGAAEVADTGAAPTPSTRPERIEEPPPVRETGNPTNVEVTGGVRREALMGGLAAAVTLARVGALVDAVYLEQAKAALPTDVLMIDATTLYEALGREFPETSQPGVPGVPEVPDGSV